jgi:hypothetical protein
MNIQFFKSVEIIRRGLSRKEKIRGDEPVWDIIIYTWKCHNETPCIAILYKQKCLFSKTEDGKVKQVPSGSWHQWEGRGYKERVQEGECGRNIMYSCMKIEK